MKPEKFKKICKKYFNNPIFIMDEYTNINGFKTISVYFNGYGVLSYIEENYICIANKFRYNDNFGYICPCRNDGVFLYNWDDYKKLYNVGHNRLIKIILDLLEKIKIAKVEYKKQLIEKDFENEG